MPESRTETSPSVDQVAGLTGFALMSAMFREHGTVLCGVALQERDIGTLDEEIAELLGIEDVGEIGRMADAAAFATENCLVY